MQVPGVKEFREISRKQLQNPEPSLRPKLSQLLIQPIFNHKFVVIHDFLSELPLKSDNEKTSFFRYTYFLPEVYNLLMILIFLFVHL